MNKRLRLSLSLLLFVAACGGVAQKPRHAGHSSSMDGEGEAAPAAERSFSSVPCTDDPRACISQLSQEIGDARRHLGLDFEPGADDVSEAHEAPAPMSTDADTASSSSDSVCVDTCQIKGSICRNSKKICELADDLNDSWADEKCDSSKVSCDEAKEQCDDCS